MQEYSVKEAVSFGWNKMQSNFGFFFILCATAVLINILLAIMGMLVSAGLPNILGFILSFIISPVISTTMNIGFTKIALMLHDNEKPSITDLFRHYPLFFKALLGSILYALICIVGLILSIVPGIIWDNEFYVFVGLSLFFIPGIILGIKFYFYQYFIVDKECGLIESFEKSAAITDGFKWQLFQLGILLAVINILGALCFFVGLLATIPLSMIALAYTYRKLLARVEGDTTGTIDSQVTNPA